MPNRLPFISSELEKFQSSCRKVPVLQSDWIRECVKHARFVPWQQFECKVDTAQAVKSDAPPVKLRRKNKNFDAFLDEIIALPGSHLSNLAVEPGFGDETVQTSELQDSYKRNSVHLEATHQSHQSHLGPSHQSHQDPSLQSHQSHHSHHPLQSLQSLQSLQYQDGDVNHSPSQILECPANGIFINKRFKPINFNEFQSRIVAREIQANGGQCLDSSTFTPQNMASGVDYVIVPFAR